MFDTLHVFHTTGVRPSRNLSRPCQMSSSLRTVILDEVVFGDLSRPRQILTRSSSVALLRNAASGAFTYGVENAALNPKIRLPLVARVLKNSTSSHVASGSQAKTKRKLLNSRARCSGSFCMRKAIETAAVLI